MAHKHVEFNEQHFIKACAWDALYVACDLGADPAFMRLKLIMNQTLEQTGEHLSKPKFWSVNMDKFENEKRYLCRACGTAQLKEDWKLMERIEPNEKEHIAIHRCPHCGVLADLSVSNVMERPVQEPDTPEPKPTSKKK